MIVMYRVSQEFVNYAIDNQFSFFKLPNWIENSKEKVMKMKESLFLHTTPVEGCASDRDQGSSKKQCATKKLTEDV